MPEHKDTQIITDLILKAKAKAYEETSSEPEPGLTKKAKWPIDCQIGPGLEGAIACETEIGYVNGAKGWLIYRGYDIFDLCAYSTFEEVSFLLLHGHMPSKAEYKEFKEKLVAYRYLHQSQRKMINFPVEEMNTMAAMRLGTLMMRLKQTYREKDVEPAAGTMISADEDSIPMEVKPYGESKAIYEFKQKKVKHPKISDKNLNSSDEFESCYHLISGLAVIAGTITRIRQGAFPIQPDPKLSLAGNLLYMMTGKKPTALEERVMDVCLILHADHGMNASTFASMVVASTLSDIYFAVGSGIEALNGPLHGGANEKVMEMLNEISGISEVKSFVEKKKSKGEKIMGFGHRVYKAYDPRARVLAPLAKLLTEGSPEMKKKYEIAEAIETEALHAFGTEKKTFPNVDFYSGIVYEAMNIPKEMFTPLFAVSRVSGWTARVMEYLQNNRIFRPRAMYVGEFNKEYVPMEKR